VLRFTVVSLRKERFVHIEGPVKIIIFVPFVLGTVDFIVRRWSSKMELRGNLTVSGDDF
jgi:hypothetical protein